VFSLDRGLLMGANIWHIAKVVITNRYLTLAIFFDIEDISYIVYF